MKNLFIAALLLTIGFSSQKSFAHCEVPCGIYHDELRIALLYEHITTIEKAINKINELSSQNPANYNQIIRWTMTKEEHANEIQHIVSQYFITQRLKLPESTKGGEYKRYVKQLKSLHELIVYAMKTKQTLNTIYIDGLRTSLEAFEDLYFKGKHRHKIEEDAH